MSFVPSSLRPLECFSFLLSFFFVSLSLPFLLGIVEHVHEIVNASEPLVPSPVNLLFERDRCLFFTDVQK